MRSSNIVIVSPEPLASVAALYPALPPRPPPPKYTRKEKIAIIVSCSVIGMLLIIAAVIVVLLFVTHKVLNGALRAHHTHTHMLHTHMLSSGANVRTNAAI